MGILLQTYESWMMITIMQLWYDTKTSESHVADPRVWYDAYNS